MKNKIVLLLIIVSLLSIVIIFSIPKNKIEHKKHSESLSTKENKAEIKGVWITYMDLDMRNTDKTYTAFKSKFNSIADNCKNSGFNTLFVQVRPFSDALYKSDYFPYSHLLTGIQGKNPNYDPLKYMCDYCHKIGLRIHAWINPYRIKTKESPDKLYEKHPYLLNKKVGFEYKKELYYNPSSKDARKLIKNGIKEIIENYNVDGIQFDDYFYPTESSVIDKDNYSEYVKNVGAGNAISLTEWRKANVSLLIAEVYTLIHKTKDDVVFGISPQGNLENNEILCADIKEWCEKEGYLDYICPQLYFSLEHPQLPFEEALNQWIKLNYHNDIELYIGLAAYKAGTKDDFNTWNKNNILKNQLIIAKNKGVKSFILYSYDDLCRNSAKKEIENLKSILN